MAKNDNIINNPVEMGRKGGKAHGGKQRKTKIKEAMASNWDKAEGIIEKNIMEFIQSKDPKIKAWATEKFSEFVKPKKKSVEANIKADEKITVEIKYEETQKPAEEGEESA